MSIWSAAGTASHMYTWLSITEVISWVLSLRRNGEKFNSILKIALYLAEEVKYKSSTERN